MDDTIRDRVVLEQACPRCHSKAGVRCVDIYTGRPFVTSSLVHKARLVEWYFQRAEISDGI